MRGGAQHPQTDLRCAKNGLETRQRRGTPQEFGRLQPSSGHAGERGSHDGRCANRGQRRLQSLQLQEKPNPREQAAIDQVDLRLVGLWNLI